jgi:GNAT superfamily N-acetyltransferase
MQFRAIDAGTPPASELIEAMLEELVPLYGRIDTGRVPTARPEEFAPPLGIFLVGFDDARRPVCGGGVKRLGPEVGEIKRMFVVPEARGRGVARLLLRALEAAARELGYSRVRLDTGPKQPRAEALYRDAGYREIADYNGNPHASFFGEKSLSNRPADRLHRGEPTP